MTARATRYAREAHSERFVGDYLPYSRHLGRHVVATEEGDLVATWRVRGIVAETAEGEEIDARAEQWHAALRAVGTPHVAIWQHLVGRRETDVLEPLEGHPWAERLDARYRERLIENGQARTEHFLSVVYRPEPSRMGKLVASAGRREAARRADEAESLARFEAIRSRIGAALEPYGAEALGTYTGARDALYSSQLSFYAYLLGGRWREVRVPSGPINRSLSNAWVFAGTETLEIRTARERRFARCLELTDYPAETHPVLLDALLYAPCELIATQSFAFVGKLKAREQLGLHRQRLANAGDDSPSEIEGLRIALDELTQGLFAMGEYHFGAMLYGDDHAELDASVAALAGAIEDEGFGTSLASTALDAAYYAQHPGNFLYRPRVEFLTSRNFACFAPMHGFATGAKRGNPWGEAVATFETPSGAPCHYSFHNEGDAPDRFGERPLANSRIIGWSSAGKTVLMSFLATMLGRLARGERMTRVYFDKGRGARLWVATLGGRYHEIKAGLPTGFGPFQLEPTPENIAFLERLVGVLGSRGGYRITVDDERRIAEAVRAVMHPSYPRELRCLSALLQNLTEARTGDRSSSLVRRLARWCSDDGTGRAGPLAWVLDNRVDTVDFDTHALYGFDGTSFLAGDPEVAEVISMYLLHRIEQSMDGRRFAYFMDEARYWIGHEAFRGFAGTTQVDIRKRNGFGVFATQMPSHFLESEIARALVEQVASEFYLANPHADETEYVEGFGLTPKEHRIVRDLPEGGRRFLLKRRFAGHGTRSVIAQLDLGGFEDELAVLSGTDENNALADRAIGEVGEDPDEWLPLYHRLRRERDERARRNRGDR